MGRRQSAYVLQMEKPWNNFKSYRIYVYPRPGSVQSEFDTHPSVQLTNAPVMEISATFIRNAIKAGRIFASFTPAKCGNRLMQWGITGSSH